MEWNKNNLINIIEFINNELKSGKPMIKIEREAFGENERVIHKRLIRLGCKKIDNQYVLKNDITSNITKKRLNKETKDNKNVRTEVKNEKLSLLLDNLDELLLLINKSNTTNITSDITDLRSNINDVRSFRIDTGIYKMVKKLASESDKNIGEIINMALEQYLKQNLQSNAMSI